MFHNIIGLTLANVVTKNKGIFLSHIAKSNIANFYSMVNNKHYRKHKSHPKDSLSDLSSIKSTKSLSSLKSLGQFQASSIATIRSSIRKATKMKVYPIRALQDNYMYLLVDEQTRLAAAIDPVNASAMANAVADHEVELRCILTTHHHYDHAHGNSDLLNMYPDIVVYGGDQRVQALTKPVAHGETIQLGSLSIECLSTPCHTRGHICYYVHNEERPSVGIQTFSGSWGAASATNTTSDNQSATHEQNNSSEFPASPPPSTLTSTTNIGPDLIERVVFTGDTLFIAGCGRFFEGTSEQMDHNLNTVLGNLPAETRVYCGHEYTVNNLKFALTVEPQNTDIKSKLDWAQHKVAKHEPTVPSTIGEEKRINPFMRLGKAQVRKYANEQNDSEVMSVLRQKKNEFVP